MKPKTLLLLFMFLVPAFAFGQINLMKFNQVKETPPKESNPVVKTDTVKLVITSVKDVYEKISKDFLSKANTREGEISKTFNEESKKIMVLIQAESDLTKLKSYKRQLEELEDEQKNDMKEVFQLKDLSKEYSFKARSYRTWRPFLVHNAVDAQFYYTQSTSDRRAKFLENSMLNFAGNGNKVSLYNEIYGDYFGPIRFGFGVLVSNKTDSEEPEETQEDAVQRLLGGGGNGIITLNYPLMGFTSSRDDFAVKASISPKVALDVPTLGTSSGEYGFNTDAALEASIFYSGFLDVLTLFGNYRIGQIFGNSTFYNNLLKTDKDSFTLNQLSVGLAINSTFRLSFNTYWGGTFVKDNFSNTISFSVIPNNK